MKVLLPERSNGDRLLDLLARLDTPNASQEPVEIDFTELRRISPAGLVALVASFMRWHKGKREVLFVGLEKCPIAGYLQRMNLLATCGMDLPENFVRHEAKGRFLPVRAIDHQVDEMGHDLSRCLAPGGEDYDHPLSNLYALAWYVLTETANNVRQHSRGLGYVSAQVNRVEGLVRIALADNGRGILKSFQEAGLSWSTGMSDGDAIAKALSPMVSSKGQPTNEGVGLTLVSRLMGLTGGWLLIVSGTGVLRIQKGSAPMITALPGGASYHGTLIGLTFAQESVKDYAGLLQQAKTDSGLLKEATQRIRFTP